MCFALNGLRVIMHPVSECRLRSMNKWVEDIAIQDNVARYSICCRTGVHSIGCGSNTVILLPHDSIFRWNQMNANRMTKKWKLCLKHSSLILDFLLFLFSFHTKMVIFLHINLISLLSVVVVVVHYPTCLRAVRWRKGSRKYQLMTYKYIFSKKKRYHECDIFN